MDWSYIPDKLLPGAWPKRILAMTIALSAILYGFFPDIPVEYLPSSNKEKFLLRLLILGISLILGLIALIFSLVREFNKKSKLNEENSILNLKIEEYKKTIDTLSKTAYDVLKHNKPPQFIPKFGVLWDKNKEPYCPSCTVLLSNYQSFVHDLTGKTEYFFRCLKCKQLVHLKDGDNHISLDDARKRI